MMFSLLSIYLAYRRQVAAERRSAVVSALPVRAAASRPVELPLAA